MRILLVDDDEDDLIILRFILEKEEVFTTQNFDDIERMILKHKPSVVLVDARMPNFDKEKIVKFLEDFDVRIGIMSGIEYFAVDGLPFVLKPFGDFDRFEREVQELSWRKIG